jgi:hypothetical protein
MESRAARMGFEHKLITATLPPEQGGFGAGMIARANNGRASGA